MFSGGLRFSMRIDIIISCFIDIIMNILELAKTIFIKICSKIHNIK